MGANPAGFVLSPMRFYPLALGAGLLPVFTIHFCYLLAASAGDVDACLPYIHSCTTISSAGREGPQFYIFKGLMIPAAVIIFVFWVSCCQWLRALGYTGKWAARIITGLGLVACLGLILYTVALGAIGPEFRVQRRIGVITFFTLSFIAQTMFTVAVGKVNFQGVNSRVELLLLRACLGIIVLFAISAVVISSIDSDFYDSIEDAFEWWVTLLLCCVPLMIASLWRKTAYRLSVTVFN